MKIKDLSLAFDNKVVLKDVSFDVKAWEFVFLIWHSWSGKTSLIRSLIWDFYPSKGNIVLDNEAFLYGSISENFLLSYRRSIGVIFQDYKLLESKKVYENVAFAMEVSGYKDKDIKKRVPEVLEQVGILIKKDKYIKELSGGEKQRVAIARALVWNPNIIIWDEPTWNLDPKTAESIMEIFDDLNRQWKTVIIATHDKSLVDKFKKRVISFKDKKVFSDRTEWTYNL